MRKNEYVMKGRVRFSEVDHTKKITLPAIINYFQDCSIMQSEEIGYGFSFLEEHKKAWILTGWQVEVKRYPNIGEKITVSTWATGFKGIRGDRNFCMKDETGEIVACANSLWVYMDLDKKRPTKPSKEEMDAYQTDTPLDMPKVSRKIELLPEQKRVAAFPIKRYQIDTNEHVNNAQYVQMALEVCGETNTWKELRVEYKKSAVYQDVIVADVAEDKERVVIHLGSEDGTTYAIVELKNEQ